MANKPHAVVIPYPAQGHIAPLMHFSIRLAERGFTVTFVNSHHNIDRLRHLGPSLQQQGLDVRFQEMIDVTGDGSTSGEEAITALSMSFFALQPQLEKIVEAGLTTAVPRLTCMVSDLYLHFTQDVANKFGLRRLAFWTASAGTLASMMAVKHGRKPPQDELELIDWIPGVPPLRLHELNPYLRTDDPDHDFMYKMFTQPCFRIRESDWVALNTVKELEPEAVAALQQEHDTVWTIGPVLPNSFFQGQLDQSYQVASLWAEDPAYLRWLDSQKDASVLYVSFGSIAILSEQQFEELAVGLEASGVPLLWVIREDLMRGANGVFPEGFLERVRLRSCFVGWAPQLRVLSHKAVGGFLSHCGWNSVLESLSAGVPVLGWPYFSDQMLNNRCCVDKWNVGLDLEPDAGGLIGRREIECKARTLMLQAGRALHAGAAAWRDVVHEAVGVHGSSTGDWSRLVESLYEPAP